MGIRPVAAGLLCGTQKLKFAVSPSDPVTYACAAFLLVAVIVLALLVPAHRAASVSPLTALKAE